MSDFLDDLLQGGDAYNVEKSDRRASIRPSLNNETGLKDFQLIVEHIFRNAGDGFEVYRYHRSSDHAGNLYDLVVISLMEPASK